MADNHTRWPQVVEWQAGQTYASCSCGESEQFPLCDQSVAVCNPTIHTVTKTQLHWLCRCKGTATPPFCDGAHQVLAKK